MNRWIVRPAGEEDLDQMMELIKMAVCYMKKNGIAQWNDRYPRKEQFLDDIRRQESFVCTYNGYIAGTAALSLREEPTYEIIEGGQWLTRGPYGVIHRIAVDDRFKGQGLAGIFVDYIENMCIKSGFASVRVDTHKDNLSMRRFLEKRGFVQCGTIYLPDGASRVAYEKVL